jgi:uncharacterized glyoxalase superfamily protein PhnB
MKPTPTGWPRLSQCIFYEDPAKAIDWLCRAFGFEVKLKVEGEGGRIEHSELVFGEGLIMVGGTNKGDAGKEAWQSRQVSPRSIGGGNTQSLCVFVDDVDAHCVRARAAGAKIIREPKTDDYGEDYWSDRTYGAEDLDGHIWWFMQRIRDAKPLGK